MGTLMFIQFSRSQQLRVFNHRLARKMVEAQKFPSWFCWMAFVWLHYAVDLLPKQL